MALIRDFSRRSGITSEAGLDAVELSGVLGPAGEVIIRNTLVDGQTGAGSGTPNERSDGQLGSIAQGAFRAMVWYERFVALPYVPASLDRWTVMGPNEIHGGPTGQAPFEPGVTPTYPDGTRRRRASAHQADTGWALNTQVMHTIVLGRWYANRFLVQYDHGGTGYARWYVDGVLAASFTGQISDGVNGYWKFANYRNAQINGPAIWDCSSGRIYDVDPGPFLIPGGGGGVDTTPPLAPTAFSAGPASGPTVPMTWTLPTDTDRAQFVIARKSTAWTTQAPSAGTTAYSASPGAAGSGSATNSAVPSGTWYYRAFTIDAAGNVAAGPTATVVVPVSVELTPVSHFDHDFDGTAATDPDQAVWSDPDLRLTGLTAGSAPKRDGNGFLASSAVASAPSAYGSAIVQRRIPLAFPVGPGKRALQVEMGGAGPSGGSTSFYLVSQATTAGDNLTNVYASPNWLRFELIGTTFRIMRRVGGGTVDTLYSGTAPAGATFDVWLLIDRDSLIVEAGGVEVLDTAPWSASPYDQAFLYLEVSNNSATPWVAKFRQVRFMRSTPHLPATPAAVVSPGQTAYSLDYGELEGPPPDEDLVEVYHYFIDAGEVAVGASSDLIGAELPPGTYTLGVQTENASPFVEP